jgi:hypothetical protein
MKLLRSVSRRGFNVATAGWFTVLKPNTWFPASRLPRTSPGPGIRMGGTVGGAMSPASLPGHSLRWAAMERSAEDRNRIRLTSAILGGLAITSAMLWWIMHP